MRKKNFLSYVAGFLTAAALFGFCVPTLAASIQKQLTATYKDIKLYVDGKEVVPKDAGGNVVEPFVSNGTTYLPVRAVGEAFGKEVTWDGTTNSVYIGEKPASGVSVERTSFSLGTMQYSIDSSWVSRDNVDSRYHYAKFIGDALNGYIYVQRSDLGMDTSSETLANTALSSLMDGFKNGDTISNLVPGKSEKIAGHYAQYGTFDFISEKMSLPGKIAFILDGSQAYAIVAIIQQSESAKLDKIFSDVIASVQFSSSTENSTGNNTGSSTEKTYEERLKDVAKRSLMGEEITYSKYLQIKTGMTYIEVAEIIGDLGEITVQSGNITIRSWQNSDYGVASILFTNGKVTTKSQAGL